MMATAVPDPLDVRVIKLTRDRPSTEHGVETALGQLLQAETAAAMMEVLRQRMVWGDERSAQGKDLLRGLFVGVCLL